MAYVFGIPALVFLVLLVFGGLTGRLRLTSCCAVADPRKDLRMRAAFEDEDSPETASGGQAPPKPDRR
jgi:hypothetical protein